MDPSPICRSLNVVVLRGRPLPNDLVPKTFRSEYCVQEQFEVMAGGGVAVEVDGAGFFEDSAEFDEARGHHGEIGEHVGAVEEGVEGTHDFGDAASGFDDFLIAAGGLFVPLPGVFEGGDLGGGAGGAFFREEDVVVLAGAEGRGEVDEGDGM